MTPSHGVGEDCPMKNRLRIVVADDERDMRDYFKDVLARLGHEVAGCAASGKELVKLCASCHPDLVIADLRMPDMNGVEASLALNRDKPTPIIIVSAYQDAELLARCGGDHVMAYLVKPVRELDLRMAITLTMLRFESLLALYAETTDLKQALEDRKVVERAKGILTKRLRIDEPEAFRRLQKLSSARNHKLIDVARSVLTAEEIYAALEKVV